MIIEDKWHFFCKSTKFLSGVFIINNKKIREFSCGKIQSKENLVVKKAKQREDSSIRMIKQREDSGEK